MGNVASFEIRLASLGDYLPLKMAYMTFEKALLSEKSGPATDYDRLDLSIEQRLRREIFSVCYARDELIAFVSIRLPSMPASGGLFKDPSGGAVITSVYVMESYRRQSVASNILKFSFEYLKSLNVREVILAVRTDNFEAMGLYKKLGFKLGTVWMSKST